jgi:hypothetical protein
VLAIKFNTLYSICTSSTAHLPHISSLVCCHPCSTTTTKTYSFREVVQPNEYSELNNFGSSQAFVHIHMAKHYDERGKRGGNMRGKHTKGTSSQRSLEELPSGSRLESMSSLPSIGDLGFDFEEDLALIDTVPGSPEDLAVAGSWIAAITSTFLPRYYRNERFNLQCFPGCQEYGDYATWKRQGKKHAKRTGCTLGVTALVYTPHAGVAYGDILALGHITRQDDNPHDYFIVGKTYDYAHIQSLMEPPPPLESSSSPDSTSKSKSKPTGGGQPALIRGINPEMEAESNVRMIDDQPVEMQFFPPEDRWFQQQSLHKAKKASGKFQFELLVFHLPVSYDVNKKLEYHLVGKQHSDVFHIVSTRTLKRELQATKQPTPNAKRDAKVPVKRERGGDELIDKRKKVRENPKNKPARRPSDESDVNSGSSVSDSESNSSDESDNSEPYSSAGSDCEVPIVNSRKDYSVSVSSTDDSDDDTISGKWVDSVNASPKQHVAKTKRPDATREESDPQFVSFKRIPVFKPKASNILATDEDIAGMCACIYISMSLCLYVSM